MSDNDLRKLYENIQRGDEYVAPKRETELYNSIYIENSDVDALNIDGQLIGRSNTVLVMDNQGVWTGYRVGTGIRYELMEELEGLEDKQELIDMIKDQAKSASIIEDLAMSSFRDVLVNLREFIIDSAKLTKESSKMASQKSVPVIAVDIMNNIKDFRFQDQLVKFMSSKDKVKQFNLFEIIDDVKGHAGVHFDLDQHSHMRYMMPAGEDVKARGAAGPGEALLSFIYNGKKPEGAGDILLGRPATVKGKPEEDWTIELKYNQGRIGKDITPGAVKRIPGLFISKKAQFISYLGTTFAKDPTAGPSNKVYVFPTAQGNVFATKNQIDQYITDQETPEAQPVISAMVANNVLRTNKNGTQKIVGLGDFEPKQKEGSLGFEEGYGVITDDEALDSTLDEFSVKYAGITKGKYPDIPFNMYGDGTKISTGSTLADTLRLLKGTHDKHKVENLVGAIHIKNYLTHIQPFTWLVVYDEDGNARSIKHEEIVNSSVVDLVDLIHANGLRFGPRTDGGGFDLRFL